MISQIDPTKPTSGNASTADVRSNFAHAKSEIESLLPLAGGTVTGTTTFAGTAPNLALDGAANTFRTLRFTTAGKARISLGIDSTAESGGNAGSQFVMSSFNDDGSPGVSSFLTIRRDTGRVTFNNTGPLFASNMGATLAAGNTTGIRQVSNFTGTINAPGYVGFNQYGVSTDTLAYTGGCLFHTMIGQNFGGAGFSGNRGLLNLTLTQTGPVAGTSTSGGMVSLFAGVVTSDTWGAPAGYHRGSVWGVNVFNQIGARTPDLLANIGIEVDMQAAAGADYQYATGVEVVPTVGHQQPATAYSAGYLLAGQTGTIGIDYGFWISGWALQDNSTLFATRFAADRPTFSLRRGFDLRAPTFTKDVFLTSGFAIAPSGRVRVGTGYIDLTGTGMSLHVDGAVCTGGTLTGPVTTAKVADLNQYYAEDDHGGMWAVTFPEGTTTITGITQATAGHVQGIPPANPVMLTPIDDLKRFGPGPITANLTWDTSRNALAIQPSGGATTFGGPVTLPANTSVDTATVIAAGGPTSIARTLTNRFGEVLNVKDYGAVGDGITDDRAAIVAAMTRASNSTVKTIYFPASSTAYMCSSSISVPSGVCVFAYPGTATLKATANNSTTPLLLNMEGASSQNILIYGLIFDGNITGQTGTGGARNSTRLVGVAGATNVVIDHCTFQNSYGMGVQFANNMSYSGVRHCRFDNIGMYWHTSGLLADAKQGVTFTDPVGVSIMNFAEYNTFTNIGYDCINVGNQIGFMARGNRGYLNNQQWYASGVGNALVFSSGGTGTQVIDNIGWRASGATFDLAGEIDLTVIGNKSYGAGVTGISIGTGINYGIATGTRNAVISGNIVMNSGQATPTPPTSAGLSFTKGGAGGGSTSEVAVTGNIFSDDQGTHTQSYGVGAFDSGNGLPTLIGVTIDPSNHMAGNLTAAFGGGMGYSESFGSVNAASGNDLSKHIALYGTTVGFNVTGGNTIGVIAGGAVAATITSAALVVQGNLRINGNTGFNGAAAIAKPTVSGAKGSNAALGSLITALASYGLVTDSTTA